MIIIEMNGGLGNQLQQYALYERFVSLGRDVRLDLSWYEQGKEADGKAVMPRDPELNYFPGVNYRVCSREEKQQLAGKEGFFAKAVRKLGLAESVRYYEHQMYDEDIFLMDQKILSGYWACEAYYAGILEELRQKLRFPASGNAAHEVLKQEIRERTAVSIHLRRGDYLAGENRKMFGGICTDAYYEGAIRYIRERVEAPCFYVFSDDPAYASAYFAPLLEEMQWSTVDVNRGRDSFYDMELMSLCRHNICANSTFSFWGARLGEGERMKLRPLKQKNGVDWYQPEAMRRLWKGWICMDENGEAV